LSISHGLELPRKPKKNIIKRNLKDLKFDICTTNNFNATHAWRFKEEKLFYP